MYIPFSCFKKKKYIPISFRWHYIRQRPCSSDKGRGSDCRLEKHINNRTINEKRSPWWERNGRWRHKFIPESAAVFCNDSHFVFIWTISDGCDFTKAKFLHFAVVFWSPLLPQRLSDEHGQHITQLWNYW